MEGGTSCLVGRESVVDEWAMKFLLDCFERVRTKSSHNHIAHRATAHSGIFRTPSPGPRQEHIPRLMFEQLDLMDTLYYQQNPVFPRSVAVPYYM